MSKYGITDLGADLWPCTICCTITVLSFMVCSECRTRLKNGESEHDIRASIFTNNATQRTGK